MTSNPEQAYSRIETEVGIFVPCSGKGAQGADEFTLEKDGVLDETFIGEIEILFYHRKKDMKSLRTQCPELDEKIGHRTNSHVSLCSSQQRSVAKCAGQSVQKCIDKNFIQTSMVNAGKRLQRNSRHSRAF